MDHVYSIDQNALCCIAGYAFLIGTFFGALASEPRPKRKKRPID
jgi:hypothetical protein